MASPEDAVCSYGLCSYGPPLGPQLSWWKFHTSQRLSLITEFEIRSEPSTLQRTSFFFFNISVHADG